MWNPFRKRDPWGGFPAEVESNFRFLESEFGFKPPAVRRHKWFIEMTYLSETTGVVVCYERWKEPDVCVLLSEAYDLTKPTRGTFRGFDLGFIVQLRGGRVLEYDRWNFDVKEIVHAYAEQTRKFGDRILKGDFTEFRQLGWHVHDP